MTKIYKRRFAELQASDAGQKHVNSVERAVHNGLEYLIPLVEFGKLQAIYLDLGDRRAEAAASGQGARNVVAVKYLYIPPAVYNC